MTEFETLDGKEKNNKENAVFPPFFGSLHLKAIHIFGQV